MFQTSGAHTDELLYESAVLASEIDQGLSFEDTLKALRKRLCSGSESDIEHLEANFLADLVKSALTSLATK